MVAGVHNQNPSTIGPPAAEPAVQSGSPGRRQRTGRFARRAVLRLGAAGAAGLAVASLGTGCSVLRPSKSPSSSPTTSGSPSGVVPTTTTRSPSPTPTPPLQPADAALVHAALTQLHTAGAAVVQAGVVQPAVGKSLRPLRSDHHAQAAALARLAEVAVPPSPTPIPTPTHRGTTGHGKSGKPRGSNDTGKQPAQPAPGKVYASVGGTEKSLADHLRAQAVTAESGKLAVLLASAAASASSWHQWLEERAG